VIVSGGHALLFMLDIRAPLLGRRLLAGGEEHLLVLVLISWILNGGILLKGLFNLIIHRSFTQVVHFIEEAALGEGRAGRIRHLEVLAPALDSACVFVAEAEGLQRILLYLTLVHSSNGRFL